MAHIIGAGKEITDDHNTIFFTDDVDTQAAKVEMWIAKQVGEHLVKQYPRRQWEVVVDLPGEMLIIKCPSLSKTKGYHLYMKNGTIQELQERATMAAGEILERYGLKTGREFNPDSVEQLTRLRLNPDEALTADSDGIDPIKK